MAHTKDREKAIVLREQGMSYSQIKGKLGISKSTLSSWLRDMPLSPERLFELQQNEQVIEKIRATKAGKRQARLDKVLEIVSKDIGNLTHRELLVAGFFLYWAEGGKTTKYSVSLSNTDPRMIRAFIKWLKLLKVKEEKIVIRLHLYIDMDVDREINYWLRETGLKRENFRKSYIKKSKLSDLTHVTKGHGTCNAIVNGRDLAEYVHQGLKKIAIEF